jgi:hypothetical protein
MNWRRIGKIAVAAVVYLVLTYGALDAVLHWWARVASPIPDAAVLGLLLLFTAVYVWTARRILRKRS